MTVAFVPTPEIIFWSASTLAAIVVIVSGLLRVASRLGNIERHLAVISNDVEWLKRSHMRTEANHAPSA